MNGENRRPSRVAAVIACFLLIYIPLTFNWFRGKAVPTDILREGALYEALRAEALIVRNEELLYANSDGVSVPAVNEGERVPGRSVVATVYGQASFGLMDELKQINREILEEQYKNLGHSNVFLQEVDGIDKDITGVIRKMIPDIKHNSLLDASAGVRAVNALVLKKAEAYSALDSDDEYVNLLKSEKRRIEGEVAKTSGEVYCESPGHLSFAIDGCERELTPDNIPSLYDGRFAEILADSEGRAPGYAAYDFGGIPVKTGEPFAKIVKDNAFYLVVNVPENFAGLFAPGERIRLRTDTPYREFENSEITAVEGAYMTIRLAKYLFDFLNVRTVGVELVEKYMEGLKIPVKCLRDADFETGEAYVALVVGARVSVRKVRILASNDVYAIIESYDGADPECRVGRYDTYIRDSVNIEDGMPLNR